LAAIAIDIGTEVSKYVEIGFYNNAGENIRHEIYDHNSWYENLHPLVDYPAERARLGIVRMEGKQYSETGEFKVKWRLNYKPDGQLAEEWVWEQGDPVRHTRF
jgi:hypothetical protein